VSKQKLDPEAKKQFWFYKAEYIEPILTQRWHPKAYSVK
jgi:hypothetical protein